MVSVEIVRVDTSKAMDIIVERPTPKKGDRQISEKTYTTLSGGAKMRRLCELIEKHRATLVFVNTRQMAETLASRFHILGLSSDIHHGSLSKNSREEVERKFKKGKLKALICTSSLELGIDIGSVDLVIQYNSPRQVSRVIQRVGRSGHQVKGQSKGVIIADNPDDILEAFVIVRRAESGQLEEVKCFETPFDVLIHQIVGLVLDFGKIEKNNAYSALRKCFAFRRLKRADFEDGVSLAKELRLIWEEGELLKKSRRSRIYYYENLSTIPDEKKYFVRNTVSRESVGVLDEAFVAGLEEGGLIIFKGLPWHVVSIEKDEVGLEPVSVIAGEVPSWVGEEIPVEFEVAREAGSLRRRDIKNCPGDEYTKKTASAPVRKQNRLAIPVPCDRRVVVELFEDFVVINSTFGHKVNQTLGRVFSTLLSARMGRSVGLNVDAYRIILQTKDVSIEGIRELFGTESSFIEPLLSTSLKRTSLFKWKFVHTARRFGAVSRDVDFRSVGLGRVIKAWEDSLIFKETLKDIFTSRLDLKNAGWVLEMVQSEKIKLHIIRLKGPSPISFLGMQSFTEVVLPERAEKLILRSLKRRIQNRRIALFCLYCAGWSESFYVKNIDEDVSCKRCGARMLAPLTYNEKESIRIYRKHKRKNSLTKEEKKEVKRLQDLGGLFLSYRGSLAEVIAARGVGSKTAKRILRESDSEEELYRNVLKSERNYARTKRFWD